MNVKLYKLLYLNTSVLPVLLAGCFSALDFYCFCHWHQLLIRPQSAKDTWKETSGPCGSSSGLCRKEIEKSIFFFQVIQQFCLEQVYDEQDEKLSWHQWLKAENCFRTSEEGCCNNIGQFKRWRVVCDKWWKKRMTGEEENKLVLKSYDAWPVDAIALLIWAGLKQMRPRRKWLNIQARGWGLVFKLGSTIVKCHR